MTVVDYPVRGQEAPDFWDGQLRDWINQLPTDDREPFKVELENLFDALALEHATPTLVEDPGQEGFYEIGEPTVIFDALVAKYGDHKNHTGPLPLFEWAGLGAGSVLHLIAGEGHSMPYVLGIGVDHDKVDGSAATGETISVKSPKGVGLGINLETTSGSEAIGVLGANFSSGKWMELRKGGGAGATGALISLRNDYYGTGELFSWGTVAGELKGYIDHTGAFVVQNQDGLAHPHIMRLAPSAGGGPDFAFNVYTNSGIDYWFNKIAAYSNIMSIQQGNAAAPLGSETMNDMIMMENGNAIGFFGVAPVTRAAHPTTLADVIDILTNIGFCS